MMNLFLDTGFLIALEVTDDQNHQSAIGYWERLKSALPKIVTTTYVFDEMATFFNSRNLHEKAVEVGNRLIASPSVEISLETCDSHEDGHKLNWLKKSVLIPIESHDMKEALSGRH